MSKIKEARLSTATRVIISLVVVPPCFYMGVKIATQSGGNPIAIIFGTLVAIVGITVFAVLWAFPTARRIGEQGARLYFPAEVLTGPQPMYGVAASKLAKGRHEEAIAEYEKIAAQYPAELKPYLEMIGIAIDHLNDPDWAKVIYQRGMAAMKSEDDREALAKGYQAILS